jgi:hypothetical protein
MARRARKCQVGYLATINCFVKIAGLQMLSSLMERAGAWFLHSGIQDPTGGVARYYRSDLQQNARISTEITGYTVSVLAHLNERTGTPEYRQGALHAACFLARTSWDREHSIFPFEYPSTGLAYFFDCGIIVRGLLAAWKLSGEDSYLAAAVAGGQAMLSDFRTGAGIHPIITLPQKRAVPGDPGRWSASPGCYQLKSALAWHDLALITGANEFRQAYEDALQPALAKAATFLPGDPEPAKVMDRLHPFLYFLEGLLPVTDRPECAAAFRQGLERVAQHLGDIEPEFVRSDVYAQLLRARLYGHALGIAPLDERAAVHEAAQTATFQLRSPDQRLDGGFAFGRECGRLLPYVNPVSTAFSVQALALWTDYQSGRLAPRLEELI